MGTALADWDIYQGQHQDMGQDVDQDMDQDVDQVKDSDKDQDKHQAMDCDTDYGMVWGIDQDRICARTRI